LTHQTSWLIIGFCHDIQEVSFPDIDLDVYLFTQFSSLGTNKGVEETPGHALANET